jgi:hypothetical protein
MCLQFVFLLIMRLQGLNCWGLCSTAESQRRNGPSRRGNHPGKTGASGRTGNCRTPVIADRDGIVPVTSPAGTADRPGGPPSHAGGPPGDGPRLLPRGPRLFSLALR